MKVYFMEQAGMTEGEILRGLRQALVDLVRGAEIDSVFSLSFDRSDRFFLKKPGQIILGRVFFESFGFPDIQTLEQEIEQIEGLFRQRISPYVFFPRCLTASSSLGHLPAPPHFFEYHFLSSPVGPALALKEYQPFACRMDRDQPPAEKPAPPPLAASNPLSINVEPSYSFRGQSRLTREELSELLALTLRLKSNCLKGARA